jgi:guanylate kinase
MERTDLMNPPIGPAPDRRSSPPARLFIISAPSGAGKTTLRQAALMRFPDLTYSISYTTRTPRPGELNGRDYIFISPAEFEAGIRAGRWAEWARVHGHCYGTSAEVPWQRAAMCCWTSTYRGRGRFAAASPRV